jgi:hypothetical protein
MIRYDIENYSYTFFKFNELQCIIFEHFTAIFSTVLHFIWARDINDVENIAKTCQLHSTSSCSKVFKRQIILNIPEAVSELGLESDLSECFLVWVMTTYSRLIAMQSCAELIGDPRYVWRITEGNSNIRSN